MTIAAGEAKSGEMVALMGASGAGKSSLLDCISLRNQSFKGTVMVNHTPVTENFFGLSGEFYRHYSPTIIHLKAPGLMMVHL